MKKIILFIIVFASFLHANWAVAKKGIVLDFEGLRNKQKIGDFYKNLYGITFNGNALALIDSDDGGSGNFEQKHIIGMTGKTIATFLESDNLTMNVPKGFTGGFSFYYSAVDEGGEIVVYDGLNGAGKSIFTQKLSPLGSDTLTNGRDGRYNKWKAVDIGFDGTAKSVSFKGVANNIGFDDITLAKNVARKFKDFEVKLDKVYNSHDVSNKFDVSFTTTQKSFSNVCKSYDFRIKDSSSGGAKNISCKHNQGCFFGCSDGELFLTFEINKNQNGYYFENGKLEISKRGKNDWVQTDFLSKNFSVYGTSFDIKKHAFRFKNSSWNKAQKKDGIAVGKLAWIVEYISSNYLKEKYTDQGIIKKPIEGLWNSVGWENDISWGIDKSKIAGGLCEGMTIVSLANFTNSSEKYWGVGGNVRTSWGKQIQEHESHLKSKPKPLSKTTYSYQKNDIEALKKIIYYFLAQPYFFGANKTNIKWIGAHHGNYPSYYTDASKEDKTYNKEIAELSIRNLKKGIPLPLAIDYDSFFTTFSGSHSILNTQIIINGNKNIIMAYDNNEPSRFQMLHSEGKIENIYNIKEYTYGFLRKIEAFDVFLGYFNGSNHDPLNVVNFDNINSRSLKQKAKITSRSVPNTLVVKSHNYPHHSILSIVGGNLQSIRLKDTKVNLDVLSMQDNIQKDKIYNGGSLFSNKIIIPNDKAYELNITKDEDFPFLKLFSSVTKENGNKVKDISFSNLENNETDKTSIKVLLENGELSVMKDSKKITPSSNDEYLMSINAPQNLHGVILNGGVRLSWINADNPNLKETIIVKKENSKPKDINDGLVVYKGLLENFLDTNILPNNKYYYLAFSVSKDDIKSNSSDIFIDTYKYGIYGKIIDENNNAISDMFVKIYNHDKTKIITSTFSDKNGNYAFNNLTNGTYFLEVYDKNHKRVTKSLKIEDKYLQADVMMKITLNWIDFDTNEDGFFDIYDIQAVASRFGSSEFDELYDVRYDLNKDKKIDQNDLNLINQEWNSK